MADAPGILDGRGVDVRRVIGAAFDLAAPTNETRDDFAPSSSGPSNREVPAAQVLRDVGGTEAPAKIGDVWFEIIHVFPFSFALGNILSTIVRTIEVYNADRFSSHTFDDFEASAGEGVSITDLPSLPETLDAQEGLLLTLQVEVEGDSVINGTLDFTFDLYEVEVPITGTRLVTFPFRPEAPLLEELRFLTRVLLKKDGTEQRSSTRANPRQALDLRILRDEDEEMSRIDLMLDDWQAQAFGVPIWFESTLTTAAVSSGSATVSVASTDFADYRVGGLAIIFDDEESFEVLEVESLTPTSVTFASPLTLDYPAGVEVMPVRVAYSEETVGGRRWPVNLAERRVRFEVIDNEVGDSFADDSDFVASGTGLIDGEVLLDDPNYLSRGSLSESRDRRQQRIDGGTGRPIVLSYWEQSRRGHAKGVLTTSREDLWKWRRLLHFLRGRAVPFWIPTFFRDLQPSDVLTSGSTNLLIEDVGYVRFARQRVNRNLIRVSLVDGTVLWREITASEAAAPSEQLTVSAAWPSTIQVEEVRRIDFLTHVRLDTDDIQIEHRSSAGDATITFPVVEVIET